MDLFLGALFPREVVGLADLSDRGGSGEGGGRQLLRGAGIGRRQSLLGGRTATAARSGRCFKRAHLCKLKHRDDKALVSAARRLVEAYRAEIVQVKLGDPTHVSTV